MIGIADLHQLMVVVEVPHKDASIRAGEFLPRLTCILKSLVSDLKELSLCWIHCHGLYRRKTKEVVIELFWILLKKKAAFSEYATWTVLVWVVETVNVEFVVFKISVAGLFLCQQVP